MLKAAFKSILARKVRLALTAIAVVLGVGGLGHFGIQILKALSPARVVALELMCAARFKKFRNLGFTGPGAEGAATYCAPCCTTIG